MLRYFDLRPIAKRVYGNRNNIHSNLIQEFVVVREFGVRNRLSGEGGGSENLQRSRRRLLRILPRFRRAATGH